MKNCKNCNWSRSPQNKPIEIGAKILECRYFPPQNIFTPNGQMILHWTIVNELDFCGKYQTRILEE